LARGPLPREEQKRSLVAKLRALAYPGKGRRWEMENREARFAWREEMVVANNGWGKDGALPVLESFICGVGGRNLKDG
jgi:hypothetical protein